MRIATWNVNGLRARLDFVLHWLRTRRPDVAGLQELKLADDQFPHAEIEAAGYQALVHGQRGWNGVAILSRKEGVVTQRGLPGQEGRGARLLTANVAGLSFTTVYAPNGKSVAHEDFPLKLAWLDALGKHFRDRHAAGREVVLCGDFNICPAPIDSWSEDTLKGTICHTDEERTRFTALLGLGTGDAFREKFPNTQQFSWWDYRGGAFHRGMGLRIDFLLATRSVMKQVRSVEIDRDYRKKKDGLTASDHAPVIADLD